MIWESKLLDEPLKKNDRIFLSTGDYVICSDEDGTVLWKVKIKNQGIAGTGSMRKAHPEAAAFPRLGPEGDVAVVELNDSPAQG